MKRVRGKKSSGAIGENRMSWENCEILLWGRRKGIICYQVSRPRPHEFYQRQYESEMVRTIRIRSFKERSGNLILFSMQFGGVTRGSVVN